MNPSALLLTEKAMVPNAGKEKASAEEARRIRTLAMDVGDDPELEQLLEETLLPREMCVR